MEKKYKHVVKILEYSQFEIESKASRLWLN
jgi:hypothetical protein